MNAMPILMVVTACTGTIGIIVPAGAALFPAAPAVRVLAYTGCAAALVLALTAVAAVAGQWWDVFAPNRGAKSSGKSRFRSEPPGLRNERELGKLAASGKPADEARRLAGSGDA